MSRVAYVNGRFVPLFAPAVPVIDRGYQFADAVYEVWPVRAGVMLDHAGHLARLERSLGALQIAMPMSGAALSVVLNETLRRNRVRDGIVYLQISRGTARRDHSFPNPAVAPSVVITASRLDPRALEARARAGVRVITGPDERWARCDIKSTSLLPNVLARQKAKEAGAVEMWMVDREGFVTEAAAANAWIVDAHGTLRTRPLSNDILHGVTRKAVLQIAQELGLRFEESAFTVAEAKAAREAFMTSAGLAATAVVAIDDTVVGASTPGPVASSLRAAYFSSADNGRRE
ncbi:MAG: D-amino-acid transaminase [Caulobacterales bacterium]